MMFHRECCVFLHFLVLPYFVQSETIAKKNEKRVGGWNNYQMCLESFDVHKDKIIRTRDSREMGAKFLNEFEVESRDECLKYCCDTDRCDVFIFEEKKPGSCYLFHCGPLNDFKCKFTSHANYSSAVRTNYNTQSSAQLEEEIRISQQEHELKSLRKMAESPSVDYSYTETPVKLIAPLTPKLILTTPSPAKPACSRNQYECRLSGDCIAIYNVCDGIPQCTDGSDEAADLTCPTEKPTVAPAMVIQGPPPPPLPADILKYQQIVDQLKSLPSLYVRGPEGNSRPWELPNLAHQITSHQQGLLYPAQQMELPQLRKNFVPPGYQWDSQQLYEQNKDSYNSLNSFHEQNNVNPYEQAQPYIFNHKGSGVIGENEGDSGGVYLDIKRPYNSRFLSSNRGTWQEAQTIPSPSVVPNTQHKENSETEKNNAITTTPPCDISHQEKDTPSKPEPVSKPNLKTDKHLNHEKPHQESGKPKSIKSDSLKFSHVKIQEPNEHKSLILIEGHTREHGKNNLVAEHLQQVNENEVLRPKGAVISLALGLTVTAITATLIACRLRVVRRRRKRGHGPYAHDADYLVNGMYL